MSFKAIETYTSFCILRSVYVSIIHLHQFWPKLFCLCKIWKHTPVKLRWGLSPIYIFSFKMNFLNLNFMKKICLVFSCMYILSYNSFKKWGSFVFLRSYFYTTWPPCQGKHNISPNWCPDKWQSTNSLHSKHFKFC